VRKVDTCDDGNILHEAARRGGIAGVAAGITNHNAIFRHQPSVVVAYVIDRVAGRRAVWVGRVHVTDTRSDIALGIVEADAERSR
jgi:hypothetical protein